MKQKRGLFNKIFGKNPPGQVQNYTNYQLLNSFQSNFIPYSENAWDMSTVRAVIHAFARRAATIQPRHIRRSNGTISDTESEFNRILQFAPNPYTTAYAFYYRLATQYKLHNNAFIFPVWNAITGVLEAVYNINAAEIDLLEFQGEMFIKFRFYNGKYYIYRYDEIIHIGSMFCDNDIFGSGNRALESALQTANTFNQSMQENAKLVNVIRGILEMNTTAKSEDLSKRRNDFIRDNLNIDNNGSGVVVTDNKSKYTPLQEKQTPLPKGQLDYIKSEIYDYYGTNEKIVQNKETPEEANAYYESELKPFFIQLSQAMTNCFFTNRERGFGNEITVEGNRLQSETTSNKIAATTFLSNLGALTLDQTLNIFNLPPIGGEDGSRRVQTLNMVNAKKADKYQGVGEETNPQQKNDEPSTDPTAVKDGTKENDEVKK